MKQLIEKYSEYRKQLNAYQYFAMLASWDMQTEAPPKSVPMSTKHMEILREQMYKIRTSDEFVSIVNKLHDNLDKLEPALAHEIEVLKKSIDQDKKIPLDEMLKFESIISNGYPTYVNAKLNNDFASFLPILEAVVDYSRKTIKWLETEDCKGYNVLLDMYEPKFPMEYYDKFFAVLREKLVPFVKKVVNTKLVYNDSFVGKDFPVDKQKEFCQYLLDVIGFDKQAGVVKESEHPFTSGDGNNNVRITTHYYVNNVVSAMFSCIHEGGHALYEQNISDSLQETFCKSGASLGMHESQSRLFENIIGRNYTFWQMHYGKLQEIFPEQLAGVTVDDFYKHVNKAELSFIRTEADELTYPLHIMLRYEIEKKLVNGQLEAKDMQQCWNETFEQYFGIVPPTDTVGCLQDVHWAYGNIGYFPTYALGSAIASQLYAKMSQTIDIDKCLASGTTDQINQWLHTNIHQYGSSMYTMDILKKAVGEEFDPNYYVQYLIDKYSKIYNI